MESIKFYIENYLDTESFQESLDIIAYILGKNKDDIIGVKGAPQPYKEAVQVLCNKVGISFNNVQSTDFAPQNYFALLDILLFDIIVGTVDDEAVFGITDNANALLEEFLESEDAIVYPHLIELSSEKEYIEEYNKILGIISNQTSETSKDDSQTEGVNSNSELLSNNPEGVVNDNPKYDREVYKKWKQFLEVPLKSVLNTYAKLYSGGYELFKPRGVLIKGYLYGQEYNPLLEAVYSLITESISGNSKGDTLFTFSNAYLPNRADILNSRTYFPKYHLRNALGVDIGNDAKFREAFPNGVHSWSELRDFVSQEILTLFVDVLNNEGVTPDKVGASEKAHMILKPLVDILKRCIIVDEVDEHGAIKLKLSIGENRYISKENIERAIRNNNTIFDSNITVDRCVKSKDINGVYYITIVHDSNAYENTPLFAFQVLDALKRNNIKPSWDNVILGRKMDDTIYTRGFSSNTNACTCIIAGSRSGKGVLTLNLLASALGCGAVPMYLDCKPDMSKSLQDIAIAYGREMFAFNGSSGIGASSSAPLMCEDGSTPQQPIHSWGAEGMFWDFESIPNEFRTKLMRSGMDKIGFANVISYLRGIQLITKLIELRAGDCNEELGGKRVVAVIDELEKFDIALTCLLKAMQEVVREQTGGMKTEEKVSSEVYKYYRAFLNWCSTTVEKLGGMFTAQLGLSRVSLFFLFQNCKPLLLGYVNGIQPSKGGVVIKESYGFVFKYLGSALRTGSTKIVGNGTSGSRDGCQEFGCGGADVPKEYIDVIKNFGFIDTVANGVTVNAGSVPFKPYFVLNDTKGKCVEDLYTRCMNAGLSKEEIDSILKDNSVVPLKDGIREDVAFLGYAKRLLGKSEEEIVDLMCKGWDVANTVAKSLGVSKGLQYFMYDFHNFMDYAEDSEPVVPDMAVYKTMQSPISQESEYFLEDEFDNDSEPGEQNQESKQNHYNNNYTGQSHNNQSETETNFYANLASSDGVFNCGSKKIKAKQYNENIFRKNSFNIDENDFSSEESISKSLSKLSIILYSHIYDMIGEDRVYSLCEKDRFILVNDVVIAPTMKEEYIEKLPFDIRDEVASGRWASVFVFGFTKHFSNLRELTFTDTRYFVNKIVLDYGMDVRNMDNLQPALRAIFKAHSRLETITLGNDSYTRDDCKKPNIFSHKTNSGIESDLRSSEIDRNLRNEVPQKYKWGISSFYRNPNRSFEEKAAVTVGLGALAIIACSNPIGLLATGYLGITTVKGESKRLTGKLKNAFGAFKNAFKENL